MNETVGQQPLFDKLLIANRGEIACRIARTAQRLGIKTVALYADADAHALHVRMADEAIRLGPADPSESYLNGDSIRRAARESGSNAVHPGYGFLAENADFAESIEEMGLVFVGPRPTAIRAMGAKNAAKQLMEEAGVPIVPGYHGVEQEDDLLLAESRRIGFPILIKPVAGGGGKGMRVVRSEDEFNSMLASARREAANAFGNQDVIIEKLISQPRHIEVQIFGDHHGRVIHLFERDCSMQRRHQKIIEECPALGMTDEFRDVLTDAAIRSAQAIDYAGAGTVEFIADSSQGLRPDQFYFMEMNTRLQVEHCVTEEALGIDLVEWQLQISAGLPLPHTNAPKKVQKCAIEARLYAEDAANNFLPSIGRIVRARFPESIRVDTGVESGDTITPYFDPMIAKLIATGNSREEARQTLKKALDETEIGGPITNLTFLSHLVDSDEFVNGRFDTNTVDQKYSATSPLQDSLEIIRALGTLALAGQLEKPRPEMGFVLWQSQGRLITFEHDETRVEAVIDIIGPDHLSIKLNNEQCVSCHRLAEPYWRLNDQEIDVSNVRVDGHNVFLFLNNIHKITPIDAREQRQREVSGDHIVRAPMPGIVRSIVVSAGDSINSGDAVATMEAMKMEVVLKAPIKGIIDEICVEPNAQVAQGAEIVRLQDVRGEQV